MRKLVQLMSIVAVASAVLAGNALAAKQVQKVVEVPASFTATIQTTNCMAAPGPQVNVTSELVVAGLESQVIFSQPGGAQGERFVVEQEVVPENAPIPFPQQTVVGGLGNDPFLWLQLTDAQGRPLTSEIFLGRCSQGSFTPSAVLTVPLETSMELSSSACNVAPGPIVAVENGSADLSAINGKLVFRTTSDPRGHRDEAVLDLVLLPAGQTYTIPQQDIQGQISANPQISVQFLEGGGEPVGNEIRFGRCSTLNSSRG